MENVVTVDDLRTRLSGFFDELYPDILLPEADLMAARAEVDGAAGMRYALPLKNSALVKNWVLTLADKLVASREMSEAVGWHMRKWCRRVVPAASAPTRRM